MPVFSGIGHERDNTILDEVAHTRFDTPSKVIGGIRDRIVARTNAAIQTYKDIMSAVERVWDKGIEVAFEGAEDEELAIPTRRSKHRLLIEA